MILTPVLRRSVATMQIGTGFRVRPDRYPCNGPMTIGVLHS